MGDLLCDFHVHTNYSDGKLPLREVVDLYGRAGFDVIAITDHIPERNTLIGKASCYLDQVLTELKFERYLAEIEAEGERARRKYGMLIIPGIELSKNSVSNKRSAHVLGLGVRRYFYADGEIESLTEQIRAQGGLAIAAHPVNTQKIEKQTYYLWDRRLELREAFDAWEVASGPFIFPEVAKERLPMIASSDFHKRAQLTSWKTIVDTEKNETDVLDAIRKQRVNFRFFDFSGLLAAG